MNSIRGVRLPFSSTAAARFTWRIRGPWRRRVGFRYRAANHHTHDNPVPRAPMAAALVARKPRTAEPGGAELQTAAANRGTPETR